MKNGSKGYAGSPNKKARIGAVSSQSTFHMMILSHFEVFYWLTSSKNLRNYERFLAILSLCLEINIYNRPQLGCSRFRKNNCFCYYNPSNVYLVLLSQYACHLLSITVWKVPKYGVFSGPYFPVFSPNAGKYRPEKFPYLDTFHTVPIHWGNSCVSKNLSAGSFTSFSVLVSLFGFYFSRFYFLHE